MSHSGTIVSVVLGSYQRRAFIELTIESIRKELAHTKHEIIVVDGGSTDGSVEWLGAQKDILFILQHNRGVWNGDQIERRSWGYFMNLGFKCAQGKYVCMLSDDCLVVPGAIINGISRFDQETTRVGNVGAVAFYWRNWPEQSEYWVGLTWGGKMFVNHGLYLKAALERIGFADEASYMFYHADGDLCLRLLEAGYSCIDSPNSYVEHYSHANLSVRSTNFASQQQDWNTYKSRWLPVYGETDTAWLFVAHVDPHNTASKYRAIREVRVNLLKSGLIKWMKTGLTLLGLRKIKQSA